MTGSYAFAQNGTTEIPNKHLGRMMRCILNTTDLVPEYWSYALLHAFYIKNRLSHSHIKKTHFEVLTGTKPNISNLCTFGSRVYAKKAGHRKAKLDHNMLNGIFVGYMATTKNIYFIDDQLSNVKLGTHALFDEAHFTVDYYIAPMATRTLQRLAMPILTQSLRMEYFYPTLH